MELLDLLAHENRKKSLDYMCQDLNDYAQLHSKSDLMTLLNKEPLLRDVSLDFLNL